MLTEAANGANGSPRAVMMTVAEIARRDGVSKPTVSLHIKRLVERSGLTVERDAQGRVASVNVAEYDHLRGFVGDPSKAQAPARSRPSGRLDLPAGESYDEALRQKTWHEAERRRIELDALKGALVRRDRLTEATLRVAADIVRTVDRIPASADDLAAAVARDGAHGLRLALKKLATSLRADIASALEAIAAGAPERDLDEAEDEPALP